MSDELIARTRETVRGAQSRLLEARGADGEWNYGAHLGLHFSSQYALVASWLGLSTTRFDFTRWRGKLALTQLPDGSWAQVKDENLPSGDLNATLFNYWALKSRGERVDSPSLSRARDFVLRAGGVEASAHFTKVFLALFGNYDWRQTAYVPYVIFLDGLPLNYRSFSQWVIPHLMPIAYLRHCRARRDLGPSFQVDELFVSQAPERARLPNERKPRKLWDGLLIEKLYGLQQPAGSWGGYTVSTLLSLMALDHYEQKLPSAGNRFPYVKHRGLEFVEELYFAAGAAQDLGALMDGRYWDTLLACNALLDSRADLANVRPSAERIANIQQPGGGVPYGIDFECAPDVDDTAEAVLLLSHWPEFRPHVERACAWLLAMQNRDGGWGAFDRNNEGNVVLRLAAAGYDNSVDLFDDSSPDSTGNVLEALGSQSLHLQHPDVVRRAVAYLRAQQDPASGAWSGRWAINWIFGTACVVVGLTRVGERPESPYLARALDWLENRQNPDGGFGESTRSYLEPDWKGRGVSTAAQTGIALWALCRGGRRGRPTARRAAAHLVEQFERDGKWADATVTGTGHPGLLYMVYPSYAEAFPLVALGHFLRD